MAQVRTRCPVWLAEFLFLLRSQNLERTSHPQPPHKPTSSKRSWQCAQAASSIGTSSITFSVSFPREPRADSPSADVLASGVSLESRAGCHASRGLQRWALWGAPAWGTSGDWVVSGSPRRSQAGAAQRRHLAFHLLSGTVRTCGSCACPLGLAPLFLASLARGGSWDKSVLGHPPPPPAELNSPFLLRLAAPHPHLFSIQPLSSQRVWLSLVCRKYSFPQTWKALGESTALAGKGLRWSPGHRFIRGPWARPLPALSPFFSLICTESMSFSGGQEALCRCGRLNNEPDRHSLRWGSSHHPAPMGPLANSWPPALSPRSRSVRAHRQATCSPSLSLLIHEWGTWIPRGAGCVRGRNPSCPPHQLSLWPWGSGLRALPCPPAHPRLPPRPAPAGWRCPPGILLPGFLEVQTFLPPLEVCASPGSRG